jgi:hypothetical protein
MLNIEQFRQRFTATQLFPLLLLVLCSLLLTVKQYPQTISFKHHFDTSISSSIVEVEVEAEEILDDPFTTTEVLLTPNYYLLATPVVEQNHPDKFSSQHYVQPPTRAPPFA